VYVAIFDANGTPEHSVSERRLLTAVRLAPILRTVQIVLRRIVTTVLALGLLAGAWRPCAGGQATPEARRACCIRHAACARHKAGGSVGVPVSQTQAAACCAVSERPGAPQPPSTATVAITLAPLVALFSPMVLVPPAVVRPGPPPSFLAGRQPPRHLLLSVFLV
jgi:hypothetical protein